MRLHTIGLSGTSMAARMASMARQDRGRLSPCVCNTLRMVTRAVTQLYDEVLRPSGLRVTQFSSRDPRAHGRGELEAARGRARHRPDDADAQPKPSGARWCDRAWSAPRRPHQGDAAHIERAASP